MLDLSTVLAAAFLNTIRSLRDVINLVKSSCIAYILSDFNQTRFHLLRELNFSMPADSHDEANRCFHNCFANARKSYGFKRTVQLLMFTSDYVQSPLPLKLEKD